MQAEEIENCLIALAKELDRASVKGEVCLYGGAVMCLVYRARPGTKDVDAVFEPTTVMREAVRRVAHDRGIPDDWLNDAVKGFVVPHGRRVMKQLPGLTILVPDPEYLLAMKCLAARVDTADRADVEFLVRLLGLKSPEQVFSILSQYYPREVVKPATRFFIEEIMQSQ